MHVLKEKNRCTGCGACYNICPVNAILMKQDKEGFLMPDIDEKKCIDCGKCRNVCPVINERKVSENTKIFGCVSKDNRERISSASGGAFSVIAKKVLEEQGIVFGAAFDEDMNVRHIAVDNEDELYRLKGSKYIQSEVYNCFGQVREYLEQGRKVVFSGTPCQVAGLKSYLEKDYDNIIYIDLICHGVPSPLVWKKYISELGRGKSLIGMSFRNKKEDSRKRPLTFLWENGKSTKQLYSKNIFIKGFIQNLYLRQSCYDCQFKGIERISDITIGDYWGVERTNSSLDISDGVSLVLVHSQKGMDIWNQINQQVCWEDGNVDIAIKNNLCLIQSVFENGKRRQFFEEYSQKGVIPTVKKLTKIPFYKRAVKLIFKLKHDIKYVCYLCIKRIKK